MEFLIFPVKETAAEDFVKIYEALYAKGQFDFARYLFKYVQTAEVDEQSPYVQVQFPNVKKGKDEKSVERKQIKEVLADLASRLDDEEFIEELKKL